MNKAPKIWAHRGASAYAPENTMEAFKLAYDMRADGIELDVHLSKDGRIVVIHDDHINRTTDGEGLVKEYDYEELLVFNAHNNIPGFKTVKIPLLQDVLRFCKQTGMFVNIELKTSIQKYDGIEGKLCSMISNFDMEKQVIVSSFNHYSVIRMKQINPGIQTGFIFYNLTVDVDKYMKKYQIDAYHPSMSLIHSFLNENQNLSLLSPNNINVWSLQEKDITLCGELGINAIITNYPDRDREIIENYSKKS